MAFINIYTNNLSRQLTNSRTYIDNWVYVPGTAITGDWKGVHAFTSLDEFIATCGDHGVEGGPHTFEYVAGLLSAGLPVLFQRIAYKNQSSVTEEAIQEGTAIGVKRAKLEVKHTTADETEVVDLVITEKFGGTYGNNLAITFRDTGLAFWVDVKLNNVTLLESKRIATYLATASVIEKNTAILNGFLTTQFDRINVDVKSDETTYQEMIITGQYLSGGADFVYTEDEETSFTDLDVAKEIPFYITSITDKILYQPKFITSGGYTDGETMETTHPIADAMKALTLIRQDCRALIDLPLGTSAESQQALAEVVGYTQTASDQAIPSASVCAPWVYMQVGNSQVWMPPSYAYLTVIASDLGNGKSAYTPKAGLTSGIIPNIIKTEFEIGSAISEDWQSDDQVNINPIMRLQGGSYVIAGNSTLLIPNPNIIEENAFYESSADLAIIEIRRFVYNLGTELQYQYNSISAFETFSLKTAKFLNKMKSEGSITDYTIANISSNDEPRKLKIKLDIFLTPTIKEIEIYLNVAYGSVEMNVGGEA